MGKLVPALMATGGTVTASVGGVLLVNKYGFSQGDGTAEIDQSVGNESGRAGDGSQQRGGALEAGGTPGGVVGGTGSAIKNTSNSEPENYDLSRFEKDKGGTCVQYVFGDSLDFENKGSPKNEINEDFSPQASKEVKSCLVVSWEKKKYSDNDSNKWKGYFRWVWSFSAGDSGFVMFLTTKENSLNLEGSYYYLEKDSNPWKIKENKKVADGKSITQGDFGNTFPTVGTSISSLLSVDSQSNWGFVSSDSDISNFCANDNCGTLNNSSTTSFKESFWWKKGASGSTVTDWMDNFDTLFKEVFNGENLHLDKFKGSWTKSDTSTFK